MRAAPDAKLVVQMLHGLCWVSTAKRNGALFQQLSNGAANRCASMPKEDVVHYVHRGQIRFPAGDRKERRDCHLCYCRAAKRLRTQGVSRPMVE